MGILFGVTAWVTPVIERVGSKSPSPGRTTQSWKEIPKEARRMVTCTENTKTIAITDHKSRI